MEKNKKIDRVCFEKTLDAILLICAVEVSRFIESLELNNLQPSDRTGRIWHIIDTVLKDMAELNRFLYVHYYKDVHFLYNILKSTKRLDCPEELEKLKQAIRLKMTLGCLLDMKRVIETRQHVAEFFAYRGTDQLPYRLKTDQSLLGGTLALPDNEGKTLVIKNLDVEQTIMIITLMLNQRVGFLINLSSVKQFVQWVLHPDMDGPQMQLGCMTNEFKCIIEHFKYFNPELTPAMVGCHGIFITSSGHKITAGNFRSTTYENLNTRHAIANIFDLFVSNKWG